MVNTTVQISSKLKAELTRRKLYDKESYEEVIWDMIEDTKELSEETKRDIEKSRQEFKAGKFKTWEQVKKELG